MADQSDTNPPQSSLKNQEQTNSLENKGFLSYLKHWLKFHFFLKNNTIEESVSDVINEMSTFGNRSVKPEEQKMIMDLLDFYDVTVDEIKVPRNEILAVNENDLSKVLELIKEKKVSRIPIFRDNLDTIIGFLSVKDLFLYFAEHKSLDGAILLKQDILFVPPSMKAFDLLLKMKKSKIHIATIVDEYGGTDGIITINSIISEIVGAINEDDHEEKLIATLDNGDLEVHGRAELDDLKENYGIDLYTEEFDEIETVNGLILSIKNEIPEIGESIDLPKGYKAIVKTINEKMVLKVVIKNKT